MKPDLKLLQQNLEHHGFAYSYFDTAAEATDYLVSHLSGKTIGIGGSMTIKDMGLAPRLKEHNTVYWHWDENAAPDTGIRAANAQVYLSSVNAISETGEIINIDGTGNRVSATMSAKEAVYFLVGVNKIAPNFDKALWRARNIAAPLNARRLKVKTPCVSMEQKCYDCKSPQRICRGLTVLWRNMRNVQHSEVILIGEDLGY